MASTGNKNEILENELSYNIRNENEFYVNICRQLKKLIDIWRQDNAKLLSTCEKILDIFTRFTEFDNKNIILNNELIPIIKLLEIHTDNNTNFLTKLLRTVSLFIESNLDTLKNFCLQGGIPIVIKFTSKSYNYETRVESAMIIQKIWDSSSHLSFETFIDCGELGYLIEPLQEDYNAHKELILIMIKGISNVLEVQNLSVKEKLCRMLVNIETLDLLAITLHNIISDKNLEIDIHAERIIHVLWFLSEGQFIETIMDHANLVTGIIKVINNILNNLDTSHKEKMIKFLIVMLDKQKQRDNNISYKILGTIFKICQYNKFFQETAAKAGIITHLLYFTKNQNFNKIALILLFKMTNAGQVCEDLLWKNNREILELYFSLLDKQEYQASALEVISKWLQEKTSEVEQIITLPENINLILKAMNTAKESSIENILKSLYIIIQSSLYVSCSLAQKNFFNGFLFWFEQYQDSAIRLKLLKILRSLCEVNPQREFIINKYKLVEAIEKISGIDPSSQVKELAKEILSQKYFIKENFNQYLIGKSCLTKGIIIDARKVWHTEFYIFNLTIDPTINILENTQCDIKIFLCTKRKKSFLLDNDIDISSFQSVQPEWFTVVENGINKSTMNPLIDDSAINDVYLEIQYPQAEIFFEKENIQPSEELKKAVDAALKDQDPHHELMKFFAKYGHFFAQKITVGQRLYRISQLTLNKMTDLQKFHEVFDGVYDITGNNVQQLTLWEEQIKQNGLDSTYFISSDGDLIQKDDLEKWKTWCIEYPHESLKIIKKSNLTPLHEIFDPTIQNSIRSVLGIGDMTTLKISERVLMTGVFQIQEPRKYYRINFGRHLKSHNYQVFGNVVNKKQQHIEGFVVNFNSENKSGFSIRIKSPKDIRNVNWSELQVIWILVGKPAEIGFYSLNTRNILILHEGRTQFTQSDKSISLGLKSLPSSSILVTSFSYPSYTLSNVEPLFIVEIRNYSNDELNLNIINYNPLDFDEDEESDRDSKNNVIDDDINNTRTNDRDSMNDDSSDTYFLQWYVISESREFIKADIVTESYEVKFINLSSIGQKMNNI
ncbi:437_t:CDS:2 [Dentiscutata erythropus]|uniref:437_t:CDS:1 n=1 Tax=Dentiscutata erythropus TaxID=1348616 RepID=A0A9N9F9I0_9GLOM|nr:437_t:CDS:2 [Dentiscutata erythropus]